MIVIESIKFTEVPGECVTLDQRPHSSSFDPDFAGGRICDAVITSEQVHGRRFTRRDGTEVYLGTSQAVADLIGIQFECWEYQAAENDRLQLRVTSEWRRCKDLTAQLNPIKQAPWWRRLLWVFTGVRT